MTMAPQKISRGRILRRSISGSVIEVKSEIVAKAARATDMLARETDRKKQIQWAPCRNPVLQTASAFLEEIRRRAGRVRINQIRTASPAMETRQNTREAASIEMTRPRTAVSARINTRQ